MSPLAFLIILLTALIVWFFGIYNAHCAGVIGRKMRRIGPPSVNAPVETPPLTVIIAAHNQAPALRRHLPEILAQEYERFEVIVVDMRSTDETKDILERLELQHAHLRHTFVPASARDISIERLALTLGFRAATTEWVVITHPDCQPASPLWLQRIGEAIVQPQLSLQSPLLKKPDIVLGYARYDESRDTWLDTKIGFYRLWATIATIQHVLSGHAAVRADACNLAYRRSLFFEHGGFADDQDLKAGAEELLVNRNANASNTALLLSPAGMVIQERIHDERSWKQMRVFYAETRCHQRNIALYRLHQFLRIVAPWLMLLLVAIPSLVCLVMAIIMPQALSIVLFVLLLILYVSYAVLQLKAIHTTATALNVRHNPWTQLYLELCVLPWYISDRLVRRFAPRNDFRKKFV